MLVNSPFKNVLARTIKLSLTMVVVVVIGCASAPEPVEPVAVVIEPAFDDGINSETRERVQAWRALIEKGSQWSDVQKLTSVNEFVNQVEFIDDIFHWRKKDYWATPLQTVVTKGGDCEDLAIAKYFTLSAMGVDENKMRLTYVKALDINKAHMVVSYYEGPNSEPLVLDNLNENILPASQRTDLLPVYSFNGAGLWLVKRGQSDQYAGTSERLSLWQGLLSNLDVEASNEDARICLYQYYDLSDAKAKTYCSQ